MEESKSEHQAQLVILELPGLFDIILQQVSMNDVMEQLGLHFIKTTILFTILSFMKTLRSYTSLLILFSLFVNPLFAAPPGSSYLPNETLDPGCAPGDINCIVELSFLTWETDPLFTLSPSFTIGTGNISDWNTAFGWGNHASQGYLTGWSINGGIFSINTLTGSTQTFATGSTGTDFNISSIGSNHTFNIPDASSTVRGLVSILAQTFEWGKTFMQAPIFSSLTTGSIPFIGTGGVLSENNTKLFWNDVNGRLGIGTNTPTAQIDSVIPSGIAFKATTINNSWAFWHTTQDGGFGGFYDHPTELWPQILLKANSTWSYLVRIAPNGISYFNGWNLGIWTIAPNNKLEITHGTSGNSGLRFTNLTSSSTGGTYKGKVLAVNASGDVVLEALPSGGSSIANLNTLTGATQSFATGSTGTDFNISSIGSTHTFNIPDASLTARGLITTGIQSFTWAKTFTVNPTLSSMTLGSVPFIGTGWLLAQNNSNFFWNDANGQLGIGTNTPISKLYVDQWTIMQAPNTTDGITFDDYLNTNRWNYFNQNNLMPWILVYWTSWTKYGLHLANFWASSSTYSTEIFTSTSWNISFAKMDTDTATGQVSFSRLMTIRNNWNVGIGTTSPTQKLEVQDGSMKVNTAPNTSWFILGNTSGSLRWIIRTAANETGSNEGSDFDILRRDDTGASLPSTFLIKRNTGYVGIGTDTPTSTLSLSGSLSGFIRTVTVSTTLTATDFTVIKTGATGITFTLPAANTALGRIYNIVNNSTAWTISSFIDLSWTAVTSIAANTGITLQSDGTSWRQIR
jgi:hypothetical protein